MPDVVSSIGGAVQPIQTQAVGALAVVAPIAIGILGAFLVWKFGIKFFKGVSK